jgi:hypothetical protein
VNRGTYSVLRGEEQTYNPLKGDIDGLRNVMRKAATAGASRAPRAISAGIRNAYQRTFRPLQIYGFMSAGRPLDLPRDLSDATAQGRPPAVVNWGNLAGAIAADCVYSRRSEALTDFYLLSGYSPGE